MRSYFLFFFCGCTKPPFTDIYFDTIEFDADRILEVAAKAQEFKLFRLGCICENLINTNLSVDNVLILLMSSEEQHSQSVKVLANALFFHGFSNCDPQHLCLLFIRDHYVDVVSKAGMFLASISTKHPQLMVEIAQVRRITRCSRSAYMRGIQLHRVGVC